MPACHQRFIFAPVASACVRCSEEAPNAPRRPRSEGVRVLDSNGPGARRSPAASLPIATAVIGCAILICLCPRSAASTELVRRPRPRLTAAPAVAMTQAPAGKATPSGPGRVVVTISLEGVRIPAVNVELRQRRRQRRDRPDDERRDRPGDVPGRAARPLRRAGRARRIRRQRVGAVHRRAQARPSRCSSRCG